ncbi:MAG: ribosomal protein [Bacteroidetes bacterium]|nr:ribosomal protein [Bacteroidota bacterium]
MEVVKIEAQLRTDLGKKAAKTLRKQGNIPCNLYGGKENINFYAPQTSFKSIIFTPDFKLAEITVGGKTYKAILKDLQADPVTDRVDHLDFQELVEGTPVKVAVPLRFTGTPIAAAMGGKVEQTMRKLNIFALPKDLPSIITLDVSDMDFGSIKRIKELSVPGVEILHSPNIPVARLLVTRAVKEEAAAVAAPAAAAATPAAAGAAKPAATAKK